jgi:predicted nucleic acid-binding protein
VALAWCFEDEATPTIVTLATLVTENGALVPAIFHLEIANGLLLALGKKRISVSAVAGQLALLEAISLSVDTQTSDRAWHETLDLARRYDLRAYDAAYLELAIRTGSVFATIDERLAAAARRHRVAVIP